MLASALLFALRPFDGFQVEVVGSRFELGNSYVVRVNKIERIKGPTLDVKVPALPQKKFLTSRREAVDRRVARSVAGSRDKVINRQSV